MIEPIAGFPPVSALARLELAALSPATLPQVSAADLARFQEALHGPQNLPAATPPPPPEVRVEPPLTPGDAILQGLEKLRTDYRGINLQLKAIGQQPDISPAELLNLQMQVNQVMIGTQLVTQVTSKIQQDMSALLKSA